MRKFRFYNDSFPKEEQLVICKIEKITETGIYTKLLEYDDMDAMVSYNEVSTRRVKSVKDIFREGNREALMVLNVDEVKGYIDLSNRNISAEEKENAFKIFNKNKVIMRLLKDVANSLKLDDMTSLLERTMWKFSKDPDDDYRTKAYDFYRNVKKDVNLLNTLELSDVEKNAFMAGIFEKKIIPDDIYKIIIDFDACSYDFNGIEDTKNAMIHGLKYAKGNCNDAYVDIVIVKSPNYKLTCITKDKEQGIKLLNDTIDEIKSKLGEEYVKVKKTDIIEEFAKN